ncbi:MAG TPA: type II secretion system F family protein [Candidatus Thalassarchaeaceae archaeon]|nr:type II secretion system F family protein [Candidatus Thalassarchaeaceae archaeon]HJM67517.1 type II secretion system F family protein [Candidatus Thalassarchaeaceae archaeon]
MERLPLYQIAFRRMEIPIGEYGIKIVLPAFVGGLLISSILFFTVGSFFIGASGIVLLLLFPILSTITAISWPLIQTLREAILIEKEMHMFITRMGILSIGEVTSQSMFDILRQMSDYGALAKEVKAIETLVEKWHTSLPEASRVVGRQSPSPIWGDFLDRMAFSVEAGQPIDEFMKAEQKTFAKEFDTLYDTRLESIDMLKEIYISLTTTGIFGLVVAGIHLVLFVTDEYGSTPFGIMARIRWVLLAALLFVIMQVSMLVAFRSIVPDDPIFGRHEFETRFRIRSRQTWLTAGGMGLPIIISTIVVAILYGDILTSSWDKYGLVLIAILFTPFLVPGITASREEKSIVRRDESYPGFIRALGGTAQARASEPSATIKALRGIDFGSLNESIASLESRLMLRIDSERSWDWFSAEVNSSMVSRFNRIYLEGAQASGEPAAVADLVSQNTTNLLSLRRRRALSASTMNGVAYGLLVATIVSFNIAIAVVFQLGSNVAGVAQGMEDMDFGDITSNAGGLGLPVLEDAGGVEANIALFKIVTSILIVFMVLILSSVASRLRGGGITLALGQVSSMMWVAAITSILTGIMLESTLGAFFTST